LIKGNISDYVKDNVLGEYSSRIFKNEMAKIDAYSKNETEKKERKKEYINKNSIYMMALSHAIGKMYKDVAPEKVAGFKEDFIDFKGKTLISFYGRHKDRYEPEEKSDD